MTNEQAIELLDEITSYCDFTDEYGEMIDSTPYYEALDMAIKALEKQSTGNLIGGTICSKCNYKKMLVWEYNYCPNCGAKMEVKAGD